MASGLCVSIKLKCFLLPFSTGFCLGGVWIFIVENLVLMLYNKLLLLRVNICGEGNACRFHCLRAYWYPIHCTGCIALEKTDDFSCP